MNIKTKQVTEGAMYCALYGLILFLNQQTGLLLEANVPFLFSIPIIVCSARNNGHVSGIVSLSMILMTLLFGGFTTWFYSWCGIVTGFIYGFGIQKRWPLIRNLCICALCSIASNFCTVFLWAKLFGMELSEDFQMIAQWLPGVSLTTFMALFVIVLGLLQGMCIHFISILLCRRLHIEMAPMKPISAIKSPFWVGILSIFVCIIFYFCANVVEWSHEVLGILQVIWFMDYILLDYFGVLVFMSLCLKYQKRTLSFFAVLGAMIPGLSWVWVLTGLVDCIFHIREKFIE